MTREKLKDILEGIGFAAIIASLIFVGIETRNSTKQAALTRVAFLFALLSRRLVDSHTSDECQGDST